MPPFGKYQLLKRIALGGMAEIFLANQLGVRGFNKLVVVKRLLPQLVTEKMFVDMFLDEARLAASLTHPNVVQIFDLGEVDGAFFIAMEFIPGQDVLQILKACRSRGEYVPLDIAGRVMASSCEGLHYAHTKTDHKGQPLNIVHRDVSPSNILVSFDGAVKVVDFGIAKAESQSTKTAAGTLKGKTSYVSPEHIKGKPVGPAADIFALGIVFHEMLVGRQLFKRETDVAVLKDILDGEVVAPSSLRPDVPKAFDIICLKALEKDPRRRFATAQDMQLAIEQVLSRRARPVTSADVSAFMHRVFADAVTSYRRVLAELPTATPEQLAGIIAANKVGDAPHGTGPSQPSLPGVNDPRSRPAVRHRETSVLRRLAWLASGLVALGAIAAGGWYYLASTLRGSVMLDSEPPGARISLDGRDTGRVTPAELAGLTLSDSHVIRLEAAGRVPLERTIRLTPELRQQAISVSLAEVEVEPGVLEIVTEPPGASVQLDGAAIEGVTPLAGRQVKPLVDHLVRVSLKGYEDQAATVKAAAGEHKKVALKLAPQAAAEPPGSRPERVARPGGRVGELVLRTEPVCDVFLGQQRLGRAPLTAKVPSGNLALTFVNAELGLRQTAKVEVPAGGRVERSVRFAKGKLVADVSPWADIYLGDRKLGTTPLAPREFYEGTYTFRLVNSEIGAIKTVQVEIRPGQTTILRDKLD